MADTTLEAVISLRDEMSAQLGDIQNALGDFQRTTQETNSSVKGLALQEAGQKMMDFGGKVLDAAKSMLELTEQTMEYNTLLGKLEGSSVQNGYGKEASENLAKEVYSYTGDDMMAVNTVTNLQGMGLSQSELSDTLNAAIGVWTAYGDSIPIEGLTESINETAQVGKITGSLADALNWAGISEDDFNKKLEKTKTTQERNKLITEALNKAYGNSKNVYDEANKSLNEYNEAQWESNKAQAELGESLAPVNSAITELKASLMQSLAPAIEQIVAFVQPLLEKISEFIQAHPKITTAITMIVAVLGALCAILGPIVALGGMVISTVGLPMVLAFAKVAAIIAAVIAVGTLLYQNWDTIKQAALNVWQVCVDTWNDTVASAKQMKENIVNAFNEMKDWVVNKATELKDGAIIAYNDLKTQAINKFNEIKEQVVEIATNIKDGVIDAFNNVKVKVTEIIDSIKGAWETAKSFITDNPITGTVKQVIETVTGGDDGQNSAFGTNYVPRNNMLYNLHQGEAVLSRRDADKWREGKGNSPQVNITVSNMNVNKSSDIEDIASALAKKINQQRIITGG